MFATTDVEQGYLSLCTICSSGRYHGFPTGCREGATVNLRPLVCAGGEVEGALVRQLPHREFIDIADKLVLRCRAQTMP